MKTINLDMSVVSVKTTYIGSTELEIIGRTPGNNSVRIKMVLGPSGIGYFAERLHMAVNDQQKTLDAVKSQLRGDL